MDGERRPMAASDDSCERKRGFFRLFFFPLRDLKRGGGERQEGQKKEERNRKEKKKRRKARERSE